MPSKRVVYIGGFANDKKTAERVGSALAPHYPEHDVVTFSFSSAIQNPETVRKAVSKAPVVTHSAGMLAICETTPASIYAFSPPLPTPLWQFSTRTIRKRMRMHEAGVGILRPEDKVAVRDYERGSATELLIHPWTNLGQLRAISRFDAVETAIAAQEGEIPTSLIYTEGDEYFRLPETDESRARQAGVAVMRIAGVHDELPLRPEPTLSLVYGTEPLV